MIINLVLYSNESLNRIIRRTAIFFRNNNEIRLNNDTVWLNNMYIEFRDRIITINIFDLNSNWKPILKDYLSEILDNEEAYISSNNGASQYFEMISNQTDIEIAYLKSVV